MIGPYQIFTILQQLETENDSPLSQPFVKECTPWTMMTSATTEGTIKATTIVVIHLALSNGFLSAATVLLFGLGERERGEESSKAKLK